MYCGRCSLADTPIPLTHFEAENAFPPRNLTSSPMAEAASPSSSRTTASSGDPSPSACFESRGPDETGRGEEAARLRRREKIDRIAEITPAELLDLLRRVERSGRREIARRLRGTIGSVFRYAIVTLRAENDPTPALKGALLRPNTKHRAAIADEKKLGGLLRAIDAFDGWPTIKAALLFTARTCARPGEVRGAQRSEIDFDKGIWRIAAERTKVRRPHDVPLSRQALAVLRDVSPLSDRGELVFPSIRSVQRPLSDNTMNAALRRMGLSQDEITALGFRATASTILNEQSFNPDVIEAVLGHQDENAIRRACSRARYWRERVELMQKWADMNECGNVVSRNCDDEPLQPSPLQ